MPWIKPCFPISQGAWLLGKVHCQPMALWSLFHYPDIKSSEGLWTLVHRPVIKSPMTFHNWFTLTRPCWRKRSLSTPDKAQDGHDYTRLVIPSSRRNKCSLWPIPGKMVWTTVKGLLELDWSRPRPTDGPHTSNTSLRCLPKSKGERVSAAVKAHFYQQTG